MKSEIQENFACWIWNPGFWNPQPGVPLTIGIQNPNSNNWVPGIGNPWHGIQNPRLCLIPLHRATAWFSDMSEKSRKPPPFLTMCQENSIDSSRCHSDRVENTRIKWLEDWVRAKMIAYRSPTVQIWLSEGNWSTRITYIRIWDALGKQKRTRFSRIVPGHRRLNQRYLRFQVSSGTVPGKQSNRRSSGVFSTNENH